MIFLLDFVFILCQWNTNDDIQYLLKKKLKKKEKNRLKYGFISQTPFTHVHRAPPTTIRTAQCLSSVIGAHLTSVVS